MTSRLIEVTIGVIIRARMMPAVMKLAPLAVPPKMELSTGMPDTASEMFW